MATQPSILRAFEIWKIFLDGQLHTGRALAKRFKVTEKTIARDIAFLRGLGCKFKTNRNSGEFLDGRIMTNLQCPCCLREL